MTHPIPDAALETDIAILAKKGRVCGHCGRTFQARRPSDVGRFCSYSCMGLAKRTLPPRAERCCPVCRNTFVALRKHPDQLYCSRGCYLSTVRTTEHQRRAGQRGGSKTAEKTRGTGVGYIKSGARHEHRVVIERDLGRRLRFTEIVHHKDECKTRNDLENLAVISRAEHARIHFTGKKQSADQVAKRVASRRATMLARKLAE